MSPRPVRTCYMCEEVETSREHVPAACFFPERKDLPEGVDLRRNLFTVPSCDVHNSHKSQDDQYLWHIITAARGLNDCGTRMVRTKVVRSIRERPALISSLMRSAEPVQIYDPNTGQWHQTAKFQFDGSRVFRGLEHLGRALYFHHFKETWPAVVQPFPSFAQFGSHKMQRSDQQMWRHIIERAAAAMAGLDRIGNNQDAFYYQVMPKDESPGAVMRVTFYGGVTITFGFLRPNAEQA